jgi:hypothetical protein
VIVLTSDGTLEPLLVIMLIFGGQPEFPVSMPILSNGELEFVHPILLTYDGGSLLQLVTLLN